MTRVSHLPPAVRGVRQPYPRFMKTVLVKCTASPYCQPWTQIAAVIVVKRRLSGPKVPEEFTITEKAPSRDWRLLDTMLTNPPVPYAFNQEKAIEEAFSVIVKSSGTFG